MEKSYINEFQLNIINRHIDIYPDLENVLLDKYNTFLIQELPQDQYENIMDDISSYTEWSSKNKKLTNNNAGKN